MTIGILPEDEAFGSGRVLNQSPVCSAHGSGLGDDTFVGLKVVL